MSENESTRPFIALNEPKIGDSEWLYVRQCMEDNWVSTAGPLVEKFERIVAERVGARYAVATNSGTAALHISLLVAGIAPEDEVLLPAMTFVAPANALRYVGAWPAFMDVDPDYWQIDPNKVRDFLQRECRTESGVLVNTKTGRKVTAILPVHLLGHPVDMDPLLELAQNYGLRIIEDASESLGAQYKGRPLGCIGDIGCFSFNGNKIITTGGGGMIVTDNEEWARRAKYLTTQAKDDPVEWIHNEVGYNYRLTNLQAGVGVGQMEQLDEYIHSKREIVERYNEAFAETQGIECPRHASWATSNCWLYTVLIDGDEFAIDSRELMSELGVENIQARPLWRPLHRLKPYNKCTTYRIEVADQLYAKGLSLPSSAGLDASQQDLVISTILHAGRRRA